MALYEDSNFINRNHRNVNSIIYAFYLNGELRWRSQATNPLESGISADQRCLYRLIIY